MVVFVFIVLLDTVYWFPLIIILWDFLENTVFYFPVLIFLIFSSYVSSYTEAKNIIFEYSIQFNYQSSCMTELLWLNIYLTMSMYRFLCVQHLQI